MAERSTAWLRGLRAGLKASALEGNLSSAIWAPVLPVDALIQATYLEELEESDLDGLVMYDESSVLAVPNGLQSLLRTSLAQPKSPHDILKSISLGIDLHALSFITTASDAGIAFVFEFPPPILGQKRLPLGYDLWSSSAYVRHLLSTKEMLAWMLLQIHNHHVVDKFFDGVRESIAHGIFESAVEDFLRNYESDFPESTGERPRTRGYQASQGADPKKLNKAPHRKLESTARLDRASVNDENRMLDDQKNRAVETREDAPLSSSIDAMSLEDLGFARLYENDE
ncbi:hypothetical protein MMC10_001058 [Thelotrema lepadinum]|nr:hypothetical protein [Thelotrema lepadinum]